MSNSQNEAQQAIDNFRKTFTHEQKAAILSSMMIIATIKGTPNKAEEGYLEQMVNTLGIRMNDPEFLSMPGKGRAGLAKISDTLSKSNKEWFAHSLYLLLTKTITNSKPDPQKLEVALSILGDIGISEDELGRIVMLAYNINKAMK